MPRYYDVPTTQFTCRKCDWSGPGTSLVMGETYREIVEYHCPQCDTRVTFAAFPTREETAAAAAAGNEDAARRLQGIDKQNRRWKRVLETRRSAVIDPPELAEGDIHSVLSLEDINSEDASLVLTANGYELHRELAAYEDTEPAHRLFAMMRERYGDRLRSFNYEPALLYLGGDRWSRDLDELDRAVADLSEHTHPMTNRWNEIDWRQQHPSDEAVWSSWKVLKWEERPITDAPILEYREAFSLTHPNARSVLVRFAETSCDATCAWFAVRNRITEYGLVPVLLSSQEFEAAVPEMGLTPDLGAIGAADLQLDFAPQGVFGFEGRLAAALYQGGMGDHYSGPDAKKMAAGFTHALIHDRYDDFQVYESQAGWCNWFWKAHLDTTFVLLDKAKAEVTLYCYTDTD